MVAKTAEPSNEIIALEMYKEIDKIVTKEDGINNTNIVKKKFPFPPTNKFRRSSSNQIREMYIRPWRFEDAELVSK